MALKIPHALPAKAADAGTRVDLWTIHLDAPADAVNAASARLSPAEQARADAFRNETAQRNYILAHAALRLILAQQLQVAPPEIQFSQGPHGKPMLTGTTAGRLEFNLTHSGSLALVAVSPQAAVGIDVERIRPMPEALRIAERFYSAEEAVALKELPAPEQAAAFLNLWTRKEALAKATGVGIANSLARFAVTCDAEVAVKAIDGDARLAAQWTLHAFAPAPGYVAAVAVHAPSAQFARHQFQIPA